MPEYLSIDEAHGYKNLAVETSVRDLQKGRGSQLATDLDMKLWYLREHLGRTRVATLATATPIANSMIEMYVMQRYLRPDLLADAGILDADAWASQFTEQVSSIEQAPAGGFRTVTRTAKFRNLPELLRIWRTAADVKTAADLNLPVPLLRARDVDGQRLPEVVSVPPTRVQRELIDSLTERAEAVMGGLVDPTEDNMLSISSDGRTYALDARLVDPGWGPDDGEPTKVEERLAKNVHGIWEATRDHEYTDRLGRPQRQRGALQIVFADRGTPSDRWNAYDALRTALVDRGIPSEQVRFIHDAATDAEKATLFRDCRDGKVAVIVGSTEKMGVGTNIQARAVTLHHLDCPWRPADVTQREGRIVRQHNQNPEVGIYRYVTEGSFDGYMWQTVTRKAKFIEQVLAGKLDVREIDDLSDSVLSFTEVSAIAAGDMRILRKAELEADVASLTRLQRAWQRSQSMTRNMRAVSAEFIAKREESIAAADALLPKLRDTRGDRFEARFVSQAGAAGQTFTDRKALGVRIQHELVNRQARQQLVYFGPIPREAEGLRIEIGGAQFTVQAQAIPNVRDDATMTFTLAGVPDVSVVRELTTITEGDPAWLAQRLELQAQNLASTRSRWVEAVSKERENLAALDVHLHQRWTHTEALSGASVALHALTCELQGGDALPPVEADPTAGGSASHGRVTAGSGLAIPASSRSQVVGGPALRSPMR